MPPKIDLSAYDSTIQAWASDGLKYPEIIHRLEQLGVVVSKRTLRRHLNATGY